jgi:hypothetical protein
MFTRRSCRGGILDNHTRMYPLAEARNEKPKGKRLVMFLTLLHFRPVVSLVALVGM